MDLHHTRNSVRGGQIDPASLRPVAQGGYGSVYMARTRDGRIVAVKIADVNSDLKSQARFRESEVPAATILGRRIDGVPTVFGTEVIAGSPSMVMAYAPGLTLTKLLKTNGPLNDRAAMKICREVARVIAACHQLGYVHQDIKSDNIIVSADDVTVIDFGIADNKHSRFPTPDEELLGTIGWMAPELFIRQPTFQEATKADAYAIGLLLYACTRGALPDAHRPCDGDTDPQSRMKRQIRTGIHRNAGWQRSQSAVDSMIAALTNEDPRQRMDVRTAFDTLETLIEREEPTTGRHRFVSGSEVGTLIPAPALSL